MAVELGMGPLILAVRLRRLRHFYGFIGGRPPVRPGRLRGNDAGPARDDAGAGTPFTVDTTDKAIKRAGQHKSLMPDKPFFMYHAPGAMHAPYHVPTEWSDKYKGRFDKGGMRCARRRWPARRSWESCPRTQS